MTTCERCGADLVHDREIESKTCECCEAELEAWAESLLDTVEDVTVTGGRL